MGFLWTIIIGFVAGLVAKFIMPGRNEPSGFVLTTILGIVGAFLATFLGQACGLVPGRRGRRPDRGRGRRHHRARDLGGRLGPARHVRLTLPPFDGGPSERRRRPPPSSGVKP
jgi:uncharacterized membrane protein YeaQ/YmgE (transglycosylase-associated protein family)